MSTVMPHQELMRRAIEWIGEAQAAHPGKSLSDLIDEASMRFNLGPNDAEFLRRTIAAQSTPKN